MRRALVLAWIIVTYCVALAIAQSQPARPAMAKYETRYYLLHTDLETDKAREAAIRMTKMAEEYARRTSDFGGTVRKKLPFYLFADPEDYYATGAPRESSGRFNGTTLLAVAEDFGPKTWHIVQHEGFHQFAGAAIQADLPVWVNEGLAEYFGEAVFTGDGYVTGAIPQWRLERIRKRFETNEFKSIREMMSMPVNAWNNELTLTNYDQAWAMVQFLAHGEDGRYQKAFASFLGMLGKGQSWQNAWQKTFGDTRGFEQKWRDWWTRLPDHPTAHVYAQATVAALTSYLARATSQGQTFKDFEAFAAAAEIKHHTDDWLPQGLFKQAVASARQMTLDGATFALAPASPGKLQHLRCTLSDGTKLTGRFTLRQGRVASVRTDVTPGG